MTRHFKSLFIYMGVGCAIVAAVIAFAASLEAQKQNAFSLRTQTSVVRYETGDVYLDMTGKLTAIAYRQEAFDHIVRQWDYPWVEYQFGSYMRLLGINNIAIFREDGVLRYLRMDNADANISKADIASAPGIKELLDAERMTANQSPARVSKGVFILKNTPYFAVSAEVQPENQNNEEEWGGKRHIIVFFKPASAASYGALSIGFEIDYATIALTSGQEDQYASYPLRDAAGTPRAYFVWQPHRPGANFLLVMFPVLLVMFLLLAVGLVLSVTRWHTAQNRLFTLEAKAARVQEETRIKSVFFGNISHELRTPLNAIIGFGDMLKMQPFGPLGNLRYTEYVDHIITSGNDLLRTLNALIEISQIEAQEATVDCTPIETARVLQDVVTSRLGAAAAKKITIVTQGAHEGGWGLGSEPRLRQALLQVLEHAILQTPADRQIVVFWQQEANSILLGISDAGGTMPPEQLQNLGKLFLYSDNHFITRCGGIGIELVIAAALMRLMRGRLSAARNDADGTTITLHLPAAPP